MKRPLLRTSPARTMLVLLLAAGIRPCIVVSGSMDPALKVISFNLKRSSRFARKNAWNSRKLLATRLIQNSGAAIIGVQELLPAMRDDLLSLLKEYGLSASETPRPVHASSVMPKKMSAPSARSPYSRKL